MAIGIILKLNFWYIGELVLGKENDSEIFHLILILVVFKMKVVELGRNRYKMS